MLSLTDFLLARIAEDEAAVEGFWSGDGDPDFMWGPGRIQVECEAKRKVVELHGPTMPTCLSGYREDVTHHEALWAATHTGRPLREGHCPTLRALAAVYAGHPDYREEWRP